MSFLLYCIVRADHEEPRDELRLLGYPHASVRALTCGLGAVLSEASRADLTPDVPRLLAYASVIEAFNRSRSVIPMRYGSRFSNLAEVEALLRREHGRFEELLCEIEGRIEMSVHATTRSVKPSLVSEPRYHGALPGTSYLQTRRRYYTQCLLEERSIEQEAAAICAMVEGEYVRHTRPRINGRDQNSFSIHFLVPRDGVVAFSRALHASTDWDQSLLTISGPWPAYNFVSASR